MKSERIWKPHSRIKLRFLKHYLQICADHHKQDNHRKFTFVDLFCGEPFAHFDNGDIEDGSPIIALKKRIPCIFNDIDKDIFNEINKLNDNYGNQIIRVFNKDSNEGIDDILELVPPYFHSLFYIDPDNASQLSFKTVKKVIEHSHHYKKGNLRRPEILLNFPYSSISRNCGFIGKDERICNINTNFYGNTEWIEAFRSGKSPLERRENLFTTYLNEFKPYYEHSYSVLVETIHGNPLYYIIFFSKYQKIDQILPGLVRSIIIWKSQDFIREYKFKINCPIDYFAKIQSKKIVNEAIDLITFENSRKKEKKSKNRQQNIKNFL